MRHIFTKYSQMRQNKAGMTYNNVSVPRPVAERGPHMNKLLFYGTLICRTPVNTERGLKQLKSQKMHRRNKTKIPAFTGGDSCVQTTIKGRFFAGCQPQYPCEYLMSSESLSPRCGLINCSLMRVQYPYGYLTVLVITLPKRSTAFTCRHTKPFGLKIL